MYKIVGCKCLFIEILEYTYRIAFTGIKNCYAITVCWKSKINFIKSNMINYVIQLNNICIFKLTQQAAHP